MVSTITCAAFVWFCFRFCGLSGSGFFVVVVVFLGDRVVVLTGCPLGATKNGGTTGMTMRIDGGVEGITLISGRGPLHLLLAARREGRLGGVSMMRLICPEMRLT